MITGGPGVGKTSVFLRVVNALRAGGYNVGGMVSREMRESGVRVGFEVSDLSSGRKGWLAHKRLNQGPRIGRYRVSLTDLEEIGVKAISNALENADVVAIDEVGPMEWSSSLFSEILLAAARSKKLVICTVHRNLRDKRVQQLMIADDVELFRVSFENRGSLHETVTEKALDYLSNNSQDKAL